MYHGSSLVGSWISLGISLGHEVFPFDRPFTKLSYIFLANIDMSRVFREVAFARTKPYVKCHGLLSSCACACACGWVVCEVGAYEGLFVKGCRFGEVDDVHNCIWVCGQTTILVNYAV